MKKYTGYFVISSIALLFLIGFFVFFSASTYSVESDVTISVPQNSITMPISGRKTINVSVDIDGEMEATEMAKYSINWETDSNNITIDSNITSLSSPNNVIYSSQNLEDDALVTLSLMYEGNDETLSTEQVYVTVTSVKGISLDSIFRDGNTIDVSDGVTELSIPSEYDGSNVLWTSSNPRILSVSSDGYATPLLTGNVNLTASVYDEDNNLVAEGSQTITVTDREGMTDYTLSSLSVNDEPISLSGNSGYVFNINEGNSFRINAQANSNHDILIYDEDDNIYENNSTIQLVGSSMSFTICVGDDLDEVGDECKGTYTLIVGKNQSEALTNYLSSLTINSQSFDPDDESLFVCNNDGNILTCNIDYSVIYGTDKIVIDAVPVSGYHFSDDLGPGTFDLFDEDVNFVLEVIKDGETNPSAYYSINVSVQGSIDPTEKPTTNNTGSNPGTGDISSFIIFMIMLMSLVVSLFVYKKNIESK